MRSSKGKKGKSVTKTIYTSTKANISPVRQSSPTRASPTRTYIQGDMRARIEANMGSAQPSTNGNMFHNQNLENKIAKVQAEF